MVAVHPSDSNMQHSHNDPEVQTAKEISEKSTIDTDISTTSEKDPTSSYLSVDSTQSSKSTSSVLAVDGIILGATGKGETRTVCLQSLIPFLVAGFGSISAGLLLHWSQGFDLLKGTSTMPPLSQFLSVCPPLQGMKGNLDMTFTSRLSTMAHKGVLDDKSGRYRRILRNMFLIQGQSIVISLFAVLISFLMDLTKRLPAGEPVPHQQFVFLGLSALFAMALACAIMSSVMVCIVYYTRHFRIDPDNVATPLAASIGDLMTIGFMLITTHLLKNFFYGSYVGEIASGVLIGGILCFIMPLCMYIASKDEGALLASKTQWPTLLAAAVFSSGAGYLQERGVQSYRDLTAYQPLISGIAGNRAALQASRISSYLHLHKNSPHDLATRLNPFKWYTSADPESRTAVFLLFSSIPYQTIFVLVSHGISHLTTAPLTPSGWFIFAYILTAALQVSILLFLSQLVVYLLWRFRIDPDMHAIPILTALGDLIGTSLLYSLFCTMNWIAPNCVPPVEGHPDPCIIKTGGRMAFCQPDIDREYICCGTQDLLVQLLGGREYGFTESKSHVVRQFSQRSTAFPKSARTSADMDYKTHHIKPSPMHLSAFHAPYISILSTPMMHPGNFTNSLRVAANVIAILDSRCSIIVNTGMPHQKYEIIKNLARHGISARDVKYVVVTSSQPQYVGNLNLFPEAQIIFEKHFLYKENLIKGGIDREVHVELCSPNTYMVSTAGPSENSVSVIAENVPSLGKVAIVGSIFPYDDIVFRMDDNFIVNYSKTIESRLNVICQTDWIIPGLHSAFPVTTAMRKLAQC